MIRFSKRGVSTVEYAVLLAFVTIVAGCFLPDNFTSPINNIVTRLSYVFDGKKDISNMDAFVQALVDDKTPIKIKGKTEPVEGLMGLLAANPTTYSSAAVGSTTNNDSEMSSEYNNIKYKSYIGPISQILADNGYVGFDNYTWTIDSGNMLYIADRKMDINNKSDQGEHIVTTYNLNKNPPEKGSATVTYESGRYGGYFKKKT